MLFIMNPFAGVKRANRHLTDILLMFTQAGYEVITHMTLGRGDATAVAREKGKDVDLVVCCGGDGTLNETITGLLSAGADTPIGYIPAGSTNDFASSLKLPTNILKAAQTIVEGEPVSYDVGRFGGRYFPMSPPSVRLPGPAMPHPRMSKTHWATPPTFSAALRSCPRSATSM